MPLGWRQAAAEVPPSSARSLCPPFALYSRPYVCAELLARGIAEGELAGTVEQPTVATCTPSRGLLLATMQQHNIQLPAHDGISDSTGAFVPVERLWMEMGGAPGQVRCRGREGRAGGTWGRQTGSSIQ